jgi:lysylphosphatidylglycerol synthetase-like protein (DUF2156 family)
MKKLFYFFFLVFLLGTLSANNALATGDYNYTNPIKHNTITSFAQGLLTSIYGIVGWLAVIFILVGGVLYLTAGGKDSQLTLAKNTIVASLMGLALAVGAPSLLKEIKDIIGDKSTFNIDEANTFQQILTNMLNFFLTTIVALALIALIYSGYNYLSAGVDKTKIDKAKKIFIYAIIALLVSGSSIIIIRTILNFLSNS